MKKLFQWLAGLVVLAAAILGGRYVYRSFFAQQRRIEYTTQPVKRGLIRSTINSTGTVEPEELVNVGAQVGGMIDKFGIDADGKTVDYGSRIKAGSVLAQIDDALFIAEVRQAEAQKQQAEAAIVSAQANIDQAKVKFDLATRDWNRAQQLSPQGVIAQSTHDSAQAEYYSTKAALAVSEAQLLQAKAQLAEAEATLGRAQRNLGYCVIKSPVDGVIIDRRVNIGQTVVSSMSAPSLFLIAKDLKKMQVWVSVNEADVGQIKVGQPVEFTVDAFPGRSFTGVVQKIRLNATMSQNVVTFVTEIGTDNSDGTLLPYLTANVKFILEQHPDTLYVPNAALRYSPPGMQAAPAGSDGRILWVLRDGAPSPVEVVVGLNDGVNSEITGGELVAGDQVITGSTEVSGAAPAVAKKNSASPFLPTPPHRNRSKK